MNNVPSQASENKTPIGGIKFSEELVHIGLVCSETTHWCVEDVLKLLAAKNINIPFLRRQ